MPEKPALASAQSNLGYGLSIVFWGFFTLETVNTSNQFPTAFIYEGKRHVSYFSAYISESCRWIFMMGAVTTLTMGIFFVPCMKNPDGMQNAFYLYIKNDQFHIQKSKSLKDSERKITQEVESGSQDIEGVVNETVLPEKKVSIDENYCGQTTNKTVETQKQKLKINSGLNSQRNMNKVIINHRRNLMARGLANVYSNEISNVSQNVNFNKKADKYFKAIENFKLTSAVHHSETYGGDSASQSHQHVTSKFSNGNTMAGHNQFLRKTATLPSITIQDNKKKTTTSDNNVVLSPQPYKSSNFFFTGEMPQDQDNGDQGVIQENRVFSSPKKGSSQKKFNFRNSSNIAPSMPLSAERPNKEILPKKKATFYLDRKFNDTLKIMMETPDEVYNEDSSISLTEKSQKNQVSHFQLLY